MLDTSRRFNVPCMGRRFGKTALGTWIFAKPALEGKPVAWFAPTYKTLEEVWSRVERTLSPVTRRRDTQQKRIELVTGGVLDFWTLDAPDPARGRAYARAIIDEAAMVPKLRSMWEQAIRPTLTDYRGDAWLLSTPKPRAMHDGAAFFRELWERGQDPDSEWASWRMPSVTNPHLAPDEIEAARKELPELVFRQEYLAEFVDFEDGLVKRHHLRYADPPPLRELEIVVGVDLAISLKNTADWTVVATLGRHKDGRVWILSVQRIRAEFRGVLAMIESEAKRWNPRVVGIETTQYQAAVVQELSRTTTLPIQGVRPDKDKVSRFLPLAARFEQGLVYLTPGISDVFVDELLSFPAVQHDDQIDACSTAWECFNAFKPDHRTSAQIDL
jgi:predicted phage terminase large subunit-like protein